MGTYAPVHTAIGIPVINPPMDAFGGLPIVSINPYKTTMTRKPVKKPPKPKKEAKPKKKKQEKEVEPVEEKKPSKESLKEPERTELIEKEEKPKRNWFKKKQEPKEEVKEEVKEVPKEEVKQKDVASAATSTSFMTDSTFSESSSFSAMYRSHCRLCCTYYGKRRSEPSLCFCRECCVYYKRMAPEEQATRKRPPEELPPKRQFSPEEAQPIVKRMRSESTQVEISSERDFLDSARPQEDVQSLKEAEKPELPEEDTCEDLQGNLRQIMDDIRYLSNRMSDLKKRTFNKRRIQ